MIRRLQLLAAAALGAAAVLNHSVLFAVAAGCSLLAALLPRRTR